MGSSWSKSPAKSLSWPFRPDLDLLYIRLHMKTIIAFLLSLLCTLTAIAQELPRRPFLGIQMRPLPAELREAADLVVDGPAEFLEVLRLL